MEVNKSDENNSKWKQSVVPVYYNFYVSWIIYADFNFEPQVLLWITSLCRLRELESGAQRISNCPEYIRCISSSAYIKTTARVAKINSSLKWKFPSF